MEGKCMNSRIRFIKKLCDILMSTIYMYLGEALKKHFVFVPKVCLKCIFYAKE